MAGGGQLGGDGGKQQKRGSLATVRKKKKRVGFVLDMTPLVDIAFLLLTFFMFTTTMAQPQVMEMSIPPERQEQVDVKESELMTLIVRGDGKLFYKLGSETARGVAMEDLRTLAINKNLEKRNALITALKVSEDVEYGVVITVLDELNLAEVEITNQIVADGDKRERKFALVPMTEEDKIEIEGL